MKSRSKSEISPADRVRSLAVGGCAALAGAGLGGAGGFFVAVLLTLLLALGQAQLEVLSARRSDDSLLVICPLGWRPCDIVTHSFLVASCRLPDMRSDQALDLVGLAAGVLAALVLTYLAYVLLS